MFRLSNVQLDLGVGSVLNAASFPDAGSQLIDIDDETKRILLRSRQATQRPSPEPSPTSSRRPSFVDELDEVRATTKENSRGGRLFQIPAFGTQNVLFLRRLLTRRRTRVC